MKVGDKVRTKYGIIAGTVVKVSGSRVWVKYDHEAEPLPYRRNVLVKVS